MKKFQKTIFLCVLMICGLFIFLEQGMACIEKPATHCCQDPFTIYSTFSPLVTKRLNQVLEEAFISQHMVGVVVGISIPKRGTWLVARGLGNVEKKRAIRLDDFFRIGSVTKSFTTTALLQLVDEGLVSLDETIERFNLGIPGANEISIRQLCNHTSGLYNYTDDPLIQQNIITNPLKKYCPEELIQIAIQHGPLFPPGQQVKYNNTNFIIQGVIIEKLTGMPLEHVLQKKIIRPLRLRNTSLPVTPFFPKKFAHGYLVLNKEIQDFTFIDPSAAWASGAMLSNLRDLLKWVGVLARGDLLSPSTQRQRLTFVSPPAAPGPFQGPYLKFGLGIEKLGPFLGHEGDIVSYNASINYLPRHRASFVVLINKNPEQVFPEDGATKLFKALAKILFPKEGAID